MGGGYTPAARGDLRSARVARAVPSRDAVARTTHRVDGARQVVALERGGEHGVARVEACGGRAQVAAGADRGRQARVEMVEHRLVDLRAALDDEDPRKRFVD